MTDQRESSRRQARLRRSLFKGAADRKANDNRQKARESLGKAQVILSDPAFAIRLKEHCIPSVPKRLLEKRVGGQIDCSLDFIIAWKFFYPLLQQPAIFQYLEATWPGFIAEMKDTFISMVVDGPFPEA